MLSIHVVPRVMYVFMGPSILHIVFFIIPELQKMMDSIASKQVEGITVTVEMVKVTKTGIRVSNITAPNMFDEECLQMYFSSAKMSGGGKVESIEIISKTEAIITFSDPAGRQISIHCHCISLQQSTYF